GLGVACMHYLGMWALQIPGNVSWSADLVVASIVVGVALAALALAIAVHWTSLPGTAAAAAVLTLAIVAHHFTAIGAVQIVADPMLRFPENGLLPATQALIVAAAATAVLGMSLVGAVADRFLAQRIQQFAHDRRELIAQSKEQLRQQNIQLDA